MKSIATAALRVVAAAVLAALLAWIAAEAQPGGIDTAAARAAGLWPPDDAGPLRRDVARKVARDRFGLDGSVGMRLAARTGALATFELGRSWRDGRAVRPRVARALARTAGTSIVTLAVAAALALALGLRAGARPGSALDRALGGVTALATAVPPVWVCALLLAALATAGRIVVGGPAIALAIATVALPTGLILGRHARACRAITHGPRPRARSAARSGLFASSTRAARA